MTVRSGPFWDAVQGRAPLPPAAATLGLEIVSVDPDAGTIEIAFQGVEAFTNPVGNVLGGFLATMLYDTVGPTVLATVGPEEFQSTLQLNVNFLRAVRPGRIVGRGRVVRRDGDLAHVEAMLHDEQDVMLATATAIARVIKLSDAAQAV
jgi:uncharacterized protein (TIGR00369 family)